jgi:hypothetical protein
LTDPWWVSLLREQRAAHFADAAGAHAAFALPVSDRLVTRLIATRLPPSLPVKELELRAGAANQISVRFRLTRPSFLPAFTVRLAIEEQPVLPSSPVLVLRIVADGVGGLAGTALRFLQALPPGLRLDGDRVYVNLGVLLERYGASEALTYLTLLELTTMEGRIVVTGRLAVPDGMPGQGQPSV